MKICIYHPNLHLMGGGETVALTIASHLSKNHDVTMLVTRDIDLKKLEHFFDLSLSKMRFQKFGSLISNLPSFSTIKDSLYLKSAYKHFTHFDLIIDTCSNGMFFKQISPKTLCYIHFPNYTKPKRGVKSALNTFLIKNDEMFCYDKMICNSKFTQSHVLELSKKKASVLYPPVKVKEVNPHAKKKNRIVTIGRFSPEKKLEILIEAFKKGTFENFELHIIGASADEAYLHSLKQLAKGKNIFFHENMPHRKVLDFLEESKIYWHSRGYGETDPVEFENFGITTVEAMAAGCIPIVIRLGAQPEIVQEGISGFCWDSIEELVQKTRKAVSQKKNMTRPIRIRAEEFDQSIFKKKIDKAINEVLSSKSE